MLQSVKLDFSVGPGLAAAGPIIFHPLNPWGRERERGAGGSTSPTTEMTRMRTATMTAG